MQPSESSRKWPKFRTRGSETKAILVSPPVLRPDDSQRSTKARIWSAPLNSQRSVHDSAERRGNVAKGKHSEAEIIGALKQPEAGRNRRMRGAS